VWRASNTSSTGCVCEIVVQCEYRGDLRKESIETSSLEKSRGVTEDWIRIADDYLQQRLSNTDDQRTPTKAELEHDMARMAQNSDIIAIITSLSTEMVKLRTGMEENKVRLLRNYDSVENLHSILPNAKQLQESVSKQVHETFSQYMDRLEMLCLRQKEAEEKSRLREEMWRIKLEESERRIAVVTKQLRYPIIFTSWKHFLLLVMFLVTWPIVIRNVWTLFGGRWMKRLVVFLDYFYKEKSLGKTSRPW